jgi:hypothetical protein
VLLVAAARGDFFHFLASAAAGVGAPRRRIVWLASFGALIVFYIGEARITRLGEHPVFDASCTLVLTAAMLAVVWYLHDRMRELV